MTHDLTLAVTGMTCGNCEKHVTAALRGVPGVVDAKVDRAAGRAEITRADDRATTAALIAAVVAAGYGAVAAG